MKHFPSFLKAAAGLCALAALVVAIVRYEGRYETVTVSQDGDALPGVSMSLSSTEFSKQDFLLTYTICNDTEERLSFATWFRLEYQQEDGSWTYQDRVWGGGRTPAAVALEVPAGETWTSEELSLRQYSPDLPAGSYRIAQDFSTGRGDASRDYTLYGYLTVV